VTEIPNDLARRTLELEELVRQRRFGPEYRALEEEVLRLQREVAALHGEPHAVPWEATPDWYGLACVPLVLSDGSKCSVLFRDRSRRCVEVRFDLVSGVRVLGVNDEVLEAHPLTGRGLRAYGTFVVKGSLWLRELEAIDRTHPQFYAPHWQRSEHFLLCFKDLLVEVIAERGDAGAVFPSLEDALAAIGPNLQIT
jgi:hypothetical protein